MIILKIKGGLGNQLFQYALGRTLALHHNTELVLDTTYYTESKKRDFLLDRYSTHFRIATPAEIQTYVPKNKIVEKLKCVLQYIAPLASVHYFKEYDTLYKPAILTLPDNTYVDGYFPHTEYFSSIFPLLKKEYTLKNTEDVKNSPLFRDIQAHTSVSMHIRRGDYTAIDHKGVSILLPLDYYTRAIAYMQKSYPDGHFFIFSDDIEWCKSHLTLEDNVHFVTEQSPEVDMFLMSQCHHNIIANSTFSFWAAYLNTHTDKIVVSPKDWIHDSDPTLDTWVRL